MLVENTFLNHILWSGVVFKDLKDDTIKVSLKPCNPMNTGMSIFKLLF